MKFLLISNSPEFNNSLIRYFFYLGCKYDIYAYIFDDLKIMSKDILEKDFILTEVYRLEDNSIDDFGLDMFRSYIKMEKKGVLIHIDRLQNIPAGIETFLVKLPEGINKIIKKIEAIMTQKKIEITQDNIDFLKGSFPFHVIKDHHHRSRF